MNRLRFLELVSALREGPVPPCWAVPGALVVCGTDGRTYAVWKVRRSRTCRSGILVVLQRVVPPLYRSGKEVDLYWLDPVLPPRWPWTSASACGEKAPTPER